MIPSSANGVQHENQGALTVPKPARTKDFDPALRDRLSAYRDEHAFSNTELGRQLGFDGSAVSKYLGGKPECDVIKFERVAADVLKAAEHQVGRRSTQLFETAVTRQLEAVTESVRRMGGIALIYGLAGIGKTCACERYKLTHESAVLITVNQWDRSPGRVQHLLLDALDTSTCPYGASRAAWMVERLRGSKRPILVDNAHRMTVASRRWLFDFQAQSDCPLVLVGEAGLLEAIRKDPELKTFVRVRRELALKKPADRAEVARAMLGANVSADVISLASFVLGESGSVRALSHQIAMMRDLLTDPKFDGGELGAFLGAHTQMMRDYQLPALTQNREQKGGR